MACEVLNDLQCCSSHTYGFYDHYDQINYLSFPWCLIQFRKRRTTGLFFATSFLSWLWIVLVLLYKVLQFEAWKPEPNFIEKSLCLLIVLPHFLTFREGFVQKLPTEKLLRNLRRSKLDHKLVKKVNYLRSHKFKLLDKLWRQYLVPSF